MLLLLLLGAVQIINVGAALWSWGCQNKPSPLSLRLLAPTKTIPCARVAPLWQHCRSPSPSVTTEPSRGEEEGWARRSWHMAGLGTVQ